jgi:hypothetical protein
MKLRNSLLIIAIVFGLLAPMLTPAQPARADSSLLTDLAAYWKLDEASGTRYDSASTNSLTDNNTVTQDNGVVGNSAHFDKENSEYLSAVSSADLTMGDADFTIAAWAYFDSLSTDQSERTIAAKEDTESSREYRISMNLDQKIQLHVFDTSGNQVGLVESNVVVSIHQRYFVVAWHDAANNLVYISVNNETPVSSATTGAPASNASGFYLGWFGSDTFTRYMDGLIDEVGIWHRTLTADERAMLYTSGYGCSYPFDSCAVTSVWQIGNYIQDGDMENSTTFDGTWWGKWTSSPWFSQSRPSSWTGTAGNSEPLCGSYFRQMKITDEVIIPSASQKFLWYGGDMYISFGLRTQATVTGRAYLVDPFGRQIYLPPGGSPEEQLYGVQLSATDTEWQMFNMTLTDMPLGWYLLVLQAAGDLNGLMALDCVSISEGGYQQYVFNNPPLDEPPSPPAVVARLETRAESIDPFVPDWLFTDKAAFVVGTAGQQVVGLFPGKVATVGTSPVASGANLFDVARTTNWIEVLYNTPEAAPLGFDLLSNLNIFFQAINVSLQVSDAAAKYADVVQVENIETGATISLSDIEPGMESVDGTWTRVGYTLNLQPGRYRINVNNENLTQTLYLSKLCVSGGLLTIENDWGCGSVYSSFQTPDEATLAAAEAQVTAVAAITQTAAYPLTSTAAARIMATQTAAVQATRTALATANNATANAAATKTQIYAQTLTPAWAATATAYVGQVRATWTQRVALTQTQSALRSTQNAANNQTAAAQATQNARLTQTAAAQQTVVVQPNIYATMTAAALATAQRQGELATNAYILTQQYDVQQTAIAQMTTTPDGTTAAQGTAIAELNATIAALATAQAAATAVTNPTAIPATAVALSLPPAQPVTTWDAECLRPDNPFNVSWWVDYERCMVLSWFAWGPSNTAQLQDLQTMAGGKEPIGTILQIGDAFENLLNSFGIFDWSLTGATCTTSPPNATIFFEQARGILNGELDLNQAYSTYSDEGNVPIDVIVGPYIARGIHFFLNMLCALGIMQWFQWMADIIFTFLIIFYFKTRWIDPAFS